MQLDERMKKIPRHIVFDKECWTPTGAAAAIGMHRNTIIQWAKKTVKGMLNMPMYKAPFPKAKISIPIQEFMEWYEYAQN